jgi:RNA polymerase sigma-70 factor, ECF subfamily
MMEPANDVQRLEDWVRQHGAAVRGYLAALAGRSSAEDLLQEVFRRAWTALPRYREQGKSRAFLLRIADHLVIDRTRGRMPEVQLDADGFARREAQRQLQLALTELNEMQRRVLLLRYYGDLPFAEIADALGCPLNTVLSHCRRGLVALRKILAEQTP